MTECGITSACMKASYKEPFVGKMVNIENDWDVMEKCKWIPAYRLIKIFVENVDYLVSSSQPEPEPESDSEISVDNSCSDLLKDVDYIDNSCSDSLEDVDYIVSDDNFGQSEPHQTDPWPEFQPHSQPRYNPEPVLENVDSDVGDSNDMVYIHSLDDDEDGTQSKVKSFPMFDKENDMKNPYYELGMPFNSSTTFRTAVREYSILNSKEINFKRNYR